MTKLPKTHYFWEVYLNGPDGTPGCEIQVGYCVDCPDRSEAVRRVKDHFGGRFDEVISCYHSCFNTHLPKEHVVLIPGKAASEVTMPLSCYCYEYEGPEEDWPWGPDDDWQIGVYGPPGPMPSVGGRQIDGTRFVVFHCPDGKYRALSEVNQGAWQ